MLARRCCRRRAAADVTIATLFSDYACGNCRAMHRDLRALADADPGVRIVYRDWPILGPRSVDAARLGSCATASAGGSGGMRRSTTN